jgi:hypothetical protein
MALPSMDRGRSLGNAIRRAISVFSPEIRSNKIRITNDERGIVITLASDAFFNPASARINIEATRDILLRLGSYLASEELSGRKFRIEGHTDAAVIRDLMELELSQMQTRHHEKQNWMLTWGALAPAFGMMGTVVGLVNMLQNLEDKASIGPNMALAIITTLYGSLVANVFTLPISTKLKSHTMQESTVKEMVIEGVLSIQAGENTRILTMKLMAYLAPSVRQSLEAELLKD